jgi:hypothetical protein
MMALIPFYAAFVNSEYGSLAAFTNLVRVSLKMFSMLIVFPFLQWGKGRNSSVLIHEKEIHFETSVF